MAEQAPGAVERWMDAPWRQATPRHPTRSGRPHIGRWPQSGELIGAGRRCGASRRPSRAGCPSSPPCAASSVATSSGRSRASSPTRTPASGSSSRSSSSRASASAPRRSISGGRSKRRLASSPRRADRRSRRAPPLPTAADLRGRPSALTAGYVKAMAIRDFDTLRRYRAPGWTTDWPQSGSGSEPRGRRGHPFRLSRLSDAQLQGAAGTGEGWEVTPMFSPIRVHGAGPIVVIEGVNEDTPTPGAGSSAASSTWATAGSCGRPTTGRGRSRRRPGGPHSSSDTTRWSRAAEGTGGRKTGRNSSERFPREPLRCCPGEGAIRRSGTPSAAHQGHLSRRLHRLP